jgi:DNA-binding response OmpR family regulator
VSSRVILLVEDDATTASTLQLYLERAGFNVEWVADGALAMAAFERLAPTFVVLDILLPGRDGLEICRALRARSAVPILLLTAKSTERDILRGLEHGADDYLVKPFSPRELVARVAAILRRALPAMRLALGSLVVDLERHEARLGGVPLTLTPGELRLLAALVRRPGRVFRREELLAAATPDGESGLRTVDVHVANLRRKLAVPAAGSAGSTPPRLETVYGVGYRLVGDAPPEAPGA